MGEAEPKQRLEQRFEDSRPRLRAIAFRMLGSPADADDALQDAWLRVSRADTSAVDNMDAWLTTAVAHVCLNHLRSRRQRREEPLVHVPDPVIAPESAGPEEAVVRSDQVGLALAVVLDTLSPAERVAFVLHDMFGVAFDEISLALDRSPAATRQLASRARRRVREQAPPPDSDLARRRAVVDAFLAASREGDLDGLMAVLHPDVVLRSDGGRARPQLTQRVSGARQVAAQAAMTRQLAPFVRPALVNGNPGIVVAPRGPVQVIMEFVVSGGMIVAIDVLADPERLARLDLGAVLS